MSTEYVVTRITEDVARDGGETVSYLRYEFLVGKDGPFFERFAKATATEYTIAARLSEFARLILASRG